MTIYEPGRVGDGLAVMHRGEISKTARECQIEPGRITVKYGFSGRVLLGPKGKSGRVTLAADRVRHRRQAREGLHRQGQGRRRHRRSTSRSATSRWCAASRFRCRKARAPASSRSTSASTATRRAPAEAVQPAYFLLLRLRGAGSASGAALIVPAEEPFRCWPVGAKQRKGAPNASLILLAAAAVAGTWALTGSASAQMGVYVGPVPATTTTTTARLPARVWQFANYYNEEADDDSCTVMLRRCPYRRGGCGAYNYWDGVRCVDARKK